MRRGRTVVIVQTRDAERAEEARRVLAEASAESLDAAREAWWVGLRDAEAQLYSADNPALFAKDEADFRRGFEMAVGLRDQSWDEALTRCRQSYPEAADQPAFRQGFERGREYCRMRMQAR